MWIIEIIQEAFLKFIVNIVMGMVDTFTNLLDNIFVVSNQVVNGGFVSSITNYSLKLAIAILILLSIMQIIKLYILNESGEPENDIHGFFIRVGTSVVLMSFAPTISRMIVEFSNFVADDVLGVLGGNISTSTLLKKDLSSLLTIGFGEAISLVLVIITVIVSLFIISIQAGIRGVNLAVLQMTAPLFACNYVTTDKGLWKKWLQNMMSVSLTYVMQIALVNIALKFLAAGITSNIINTLIGVAWLIVCIQTPNFLKELSYSTGVSSGVSKAVSSAPHLMSTVSRFIR